MKTQAEEHNHFILQGRLLQSANHEQSKLLLFWYIDQYMPLKQKYHESVVDAKQAFHCEDVMCVF